MWRRSWLRRRSRWPAWAVLVVLTIGIFMFMSNSRSEQNSRLLDRESESDSVSVFRQQRYLKHLSRGSVTGPGEEGRAVVLSHEEQAEADRLFSKEAFNIIASDRIAMDRSIPDVRDVKCKDLIYPEDLPTASVIIIFHNEAWSPLVRTAHSVINRSPPQYLHEVILLDDFSDRPELGERLHKYVAETWPDGIVKIVRTERRSGLIRARLAGAEAAKGDVLIFLDSHCEANVGWLEPIVARIGERRSAVLCPMIDAIDDKTLTYSLNGGVAVGGFTWSLHFTWREEPQHEKIRRNHSTTATIRSPTMAGGLFAVNREFFFEIGAYDPGMDIWGGENLEISFRAWMCGGTLEFVPCSRVGHIFRSSHPYTFPGNKDTHGLNSKRLAEVWMDDYKRLFYMHRRDLVKQDAGDVTERLELRKKLHCKSFKWYLENVYPEKFILDENVRAWGMVRNQPSGLCLDTLGKDEKTTFDLGIFFCQSGASASEVFSLSMKDELRREESCLDCRGGEGARIQLIPCHGFKGNQEWVHNKNTGTIIHKASGKCMDIAGVSSGGFVTIRTCNGADTQKWDFENYLTL